MGTWELMGMVLGGLLLTAIIVGVIWMFAEWLYRTIK